MVGFFFYHVLCLYSVYLMMAYSTKLVITPLY